MPKKRTKETTYGMFPVNVVNVTNNHEPRGVGAGCASATKEKPLQSAARKAAVRRNQGYGGASG